MRKREEREKGRRGGGGREDEVGRRMREVEAIPLTPGKEECLPEYHPLYLPKPPLTSIPTDFWEMWRGHEGTRCDFSLGRKAENPHSYPKASVSV